MSEPQYKPVSECKTVAELLEDPARWTKGSGARDGSGRPVVCNAKEAVTWCILGGAGKIHGDLTCEVRAALQDVTKAFYISDWNDAPERTHAEVLAAVREAGI